MKNFEVKTNKRGVIADVIEMLPMATLYVLVILAQVWFMYHLKDKYNNDGFWDFTENGCLNRIEMAGLIIWTCVSMTMAWILIAVIFPYFILGWALDLKRITKIDGNKITQADYSYPCNKSIITNVCHQITSVSVGQSWIDLLLNTGAVVINGITKTNAGTEEFEVSIPQIDNPEKVKEEIINLFPDNPSIEIVNVTTK